MALDVPRFVKRWTLCTLPTPSRGDRSHPLEGERARRADLSGSRGAAARDRDGNESGAAATGQAASDAGDRGAQPSGRAGDASCGWAQGARLLRAFRGNYPESLKSISFCSVYESLRTAPGPGQAPEHEGRGGLGSLPGTAKSVARVMGTVLCGGGKYIFQS